MNNQQKTVLWLGFALIFMRIFIGGQWNALWSTLAKPVTEPPDQVQKPTGPGGDKPQPKPSPSPPRNSGGNAGTGTGGISV